MPRRLLLFPLALTLFTAACDGTDRGLLRVQMDDGDDASFLASVGATSGPGDALPLDSVLSVDLHVRRVEVKAQDASAAEAEQNDETEDESRRGGWIVVARPDSAIDLLGLVGSPIPVDQEMIPQGTYKAFRIVIDASRSSVTLKDGTKMSAVCNSSGGSAGGRVHFPSACTSGIKVRVNPFQVDDGTTTLIIGLDAAENFRMIGSSLKRDGLRFAPSIDARVRKD